MRSTPGVFSTENILFFFYNTSYLNKEVNRTESCPLVGFLVCHCNLYASQLPDCLSRFIAQFKKWTRLDVVGNDKCARLQNYHCKRFVLQVH